MPTNPSVISLASLDGSNGFRVDGISNYDRSGYSVSSAGDVNGDGFDDIIIGAPNANVGNIGDAGESYVVFGKAGGFASSFDLSSLNGTNGFRINGIDGYDQSGYAVSSAGDINGDGFADLLIAAPFGGPGTIATDEGEVYVVYGKASGFGSAIDLANLNGTNGSSIKGLDDGDFIGHSVSSAGDINNDGFDDFLIGAPSVTTGAGSNAGQSYVVFGKAGTFGPSFDLSTLNGSNGFMINGIDAYDRSGISVSSAGDVNGDGFADILVGAYWAEQPGGVSLNGESYVIFGKASGFAAAFNLSSIDGTNGFRIDGENGNDRSGFSVSSAGDINGDGFDDVLIGAYGANSDTGETYVIFGKASGFAGIISVSNLDGTNGFRVSGLDAYDRSGASVSSGGDINGDGFDDIIIGAYLADPNGQGNAGESYVVFGKAGGFAANIVLATLDGTDGFRIDGINSADLSGHSVSSAGDINGDGFDDILIGAHEGDPDGIYGSGESYIIFGRATAAISRTGSVNADSLFGGDYDDTLNGRDGNDTLTGGGGTDVLRGSLGDDLYIVDAQGEAREGLNQGTDTVQSSVTYSLAGNIENLTLSGAANINGTGNSIANTLTGNTGNNLLNAFGGGTDTLIGGTGDDVYRVDTTDIVTELAGGGSDTVRTTQSYTLGAELEKLVLEGTGNANGTGNDLDNTITGNTGNNTLTGGLGRDILTGGLGTDRFDFNALGESGITGPTRDVISDFEAGTNVTTIDRIDLATIDALPGGANNAFVFVAGGGAFTAAGQVRAVQSGVNTLIQLNTDGNFATVEMVIQLNNVTATNINAGDFVL